MRFVAPLRSEVPEGRFAHPLYADLAPWVDWLRGPRWPLLADINRELKARTAAAGQLPLRLVEQTPELAADGLHFERRARERGEIATRPACWHDLFNALVWIAQPAVKRALNARQAADVARVGPSQRTRAQCALTHFDEAGVVVVLRDENRLRHWERHDWPGLFLGLAADDIALAVVGHALYEHGLLEGKLLVGKGLVVIDSSPAEALPGVVSRLAEAVEQGRLLNDPQELRPLPLMGLPGWHPLSQQINFLREADCFRPLRAGRIYPAPWTSQPAERSALNDPV